MLNTNYNEMGMSGVNDETEIIANFDDVINIEGTKDLIPIPSSTFKSTGCDNLLLFDQYCQMTTVRTKRWSFISCFDDNSGIVVVYDMGIEKQITARAVSSILVVKMRESANAHLSSTVGIALIFRFGDETSRVSLSTIKEGIFKVKIVAGHINLGGKDSDYKILKHLVALDFIYSGNSIVDYGAFIG
ncbi:hypothetical protein Gorai_023975 [Gossypium raimondii]|uniref:Uncharacterized protein n=1 Tax=Gossypium raimondii TaxID=29730 RepID=A0A7J8NXR3_GOSRA|nr:hypothetical protein [Gossypium raimondii]